MIETRTVYFCYNADFSACVVDAFPEKTILYIEKKRYLFYLNPIPVSKCDRAGQGVMQEVDDVIRKAFTALSISRFILLVHSESFSLPGDELS